MEVPQAGGRDVAPLGTGVQGHACLPRRARRRQGLCPWGSTGMTRTGFTDALSWMIATVCGAGQAPVAPGTWASLLAAGVWYWGPQERWIHWTACAITIMAGWWAAGRCARHLGQADPSCVVVDEVAGMWLALIGLPRTFPVLIAGFLLFRLLDISKCPPIRQLERVQGGAGIMLDDVAAGLISRAALIFCLRWLAG